MVNNLATEVSHSPAPTG